AATPASLQAPNAPATWSTNQQPRPAGSSGPRFEQTVMELQPNPLSAMALINDVPVNMVHGRRAVCDGGGGPLGHPKIYINLDLPGPRPCGYVQCFASCLLPLMLRPSFFCAQLLVRYPSLDVPARCTNEIHLVVCVSSKSTITINRRSHMYNRDPIIFGSACPTCWA
ncbi:hypothetical protein B0H10DRAFT_1810774, partial [Mycena sp. CBHHK59/15]